MGRECQSTPLARGGSTWMQKKTRRRRRVLERGTLPARESSPEQASAVQTFGGGRTPLEAARQAALPSIFLKNAAPSFTASRPFHAR